jgi:hypothetical protein
MRCISAVMKLSPCSAKDFQDAVGPGRCISAVAASSGCRHGVTSLIDGR